MVVVAGVDEATSDSSSDAISYPQTDDTISRDIAVEVATDSVAEVVEDVPSVAALDLQGGLSDASIIDTTANAPVGTIKRSHEDILARMNAKLQLCLERARRRISRLSPAEKQQRVWEKELVRRNFNRWTPILVYYSQHLFPLIGDLNRQWKTLDKLLERLNSDYKKKVCPFSHSHILTFVS